jgi:hypothetical protein
LKFLPSAGPARTGVVVYRASRWSVSWITVGNRKIMKRREGPLRYIEIAALAVLCIPFGAMAMAIGWHYNIPTPGLYAMKLIPDSEPGRGRLGP